MTAAVRLDGIGMRFGATDALSGIDLDIAAGEYLVLLGPSGCGKSTLLSILGGFLTPTAGRVLIGGRDVTGVAPAQRPTTTMFQDYALFPHMSLRDNVGFGLRMRGIGRAARHNLAEGLLDLVGLGGAGLRRPHELSGGQRQRVALARALAVEPDVLLLDEPLGALDLKLRRAMQDELKSIHTRVGTTFVHVTHDQEEAMAIADTVVVMNAGRIEDSGTSDRVYMRPRTLFSAGFMGEANFLPALVRSAGDPVQVEAASGPLALPASAFGGLAPTPGQPVTLCIRPEHFRDAGGELLSLGSARIEDAAFFGTHVRAHCRLGDTRLIVHLPQASRPSLGAEISLRVGLDHVTALPGRIAT